MEREKKTFSGRGGKHGNDWSPDPMAAGTYGGLNLAISTTTASNDTWTLTPVAP